jgi:hypothetical protein
MALEVTEAALEGFRVVGRRPVSFLIWAVAWVCLGYGALGLLLWQAMPQLTQLQGVIPPVVMDPHAAVAAVLGFELALARIVSPWIFWVWLLSIVLLAAIYRAVLEPRKSGFAYLRLGADELRLAGLEVIYAVMTFVYVCVIAAICTAVFIGARQLQQPWQAFLDAVVVLAAVVFSIYLRVRLLFASPMTFARKRLQIFDSWGLTRGRAWSIVGLCLLVFVFILAVAFVLGVIRNALMLGQMQSLMQGFMPRMGNAPVAPRPEFGRVLQALAQAVTSPLGITAIIIQGLGDAFLRVVAAAPFAEAYRQLSGGGEDPAVGADAPEGDGPETDGHAPAH